MVTILDYGAGNLTSVCLAFERLGARPQVIAEAGAYSGGHIVFPGVGSAASGMAGVRERGFDALLRRAFDAGTPILGICLGMQLLLDASAEDGGTPALGLIPGQCEDFASVLSPAEKIPHMGWNTVRHTPHPLFEGVEQDAAFYFVHSYFARPAHESDIAGRTQYGALTFASALARGSLVATQFHPERSGEAGAKLLKNFLAWRGVCS